MNIFQIFTFLNVDTFLNMKKNILYRKLIKNSICASWKPFTRYAKPYVQNLFYSRYLFPFICLLKSIKTKMVKTVSSHSTITSELCLQKNQTNGRMKYLKYCEKLVRHGD